MNSTITLPGLEGVKVTKSEMKDHGVYQLTVEMPLIPHICPACGEETQKVHDYWIQSIRHLKWRNNQSFFNTANGGMYVRVKRGIKHRSFIRIRE